MQPAGPTFLGLSSPASSEVYMYFVSSEVRGPPSLGHVITSVLPHLWGLQSHHSREGCPQLGRVHLQSSQSFGIPSLAPVLEGASVLVCLSALTSEGK